MKTIMMKLNFTAPVVILLFASIGATSCISALNVPIAVARSTTTAVKKSNSLFPVQPKGQIQKNDNGGMSIRKVRHFQFDTAQHCSTAANAFHNSSSSTALSSHISHTPNNDDKKEEKLGTFTFKTPYGYYLNPYGFYCGLASMIMGIPWYLSMAFCQLLYKITNDKVDKLKRLPTFFTHCWAIATLAITLNTPKIEGYEHLKKFYKENRSAMIIANHNSWLDIPALAYMTGWRNYKMISKAELRKVPILGKAIEVGRHVMVDRSNRRSQLMTFKAGMQWLQDGVHLCAFPEGTRSKDGHLLPFKNGTFKMAHKVGAPVVCVSIVGAGKLMPSTWMSCKRPSLGSMKMIIHPPVESSGKTEEELAKVIRDTIISGLPEEQHPLAELEIHKHS